ncbi:MAG: hypothetical protein FWC03_08190 [Treponema sp.]|nr:hypothetical protein [Treponema sp.]
MQEKDGAGISTESFAASTGAKKQVLLRLSNSLWMELAAWAENDFRSINGQIEFLLSECVKKRKNINDANQPGIKPEESHSLEGM